MTYRVVIIDKQPDVTTTYDNEGVHLFQMKSVIKNMVERNIIPLTATLHVEEEQTRKVYFRNLLSSLTFLS